MTDHGRTRVLLVAVGPEELRQLGAILESAGSEVLTAPSGARALELASEVALDLILLDERTYGDSTCAALRAGGVTTPVIMLTARAHDAKRIGAAAVDTIGRPIQREEVLARLGRQLELARRGRALSELQQRVLEHAARRREAEAELSCARGLLSLRREEDVGRWGLPRASDSVDDWALLGALRDEVCALQAAPAANVLISGERGAGKQWVARAIHHGSARRWAPFVPVRCAGELSATRLFGQVRGTSVGAPRERKGLLELAEGGTLFVAELAQLPAALEDELVRALQDGCFRPLGTREPRTLDVRVIAATRVTPDAHDAAASFLRLAPHRLRVPPLRERRRDIPALATHLLAQLARDACVTPPALSPDALDVLLQHPFPGNVRELKNVCERALLLHPAGELGPAQLEACLPGRGASTSAQPPRSLNLATVKEQLIEQALARTHGNVTAAAQLLGVHRSWFYRRKAT